MPEVVECEMLLYADNTVLVLEDSYFRTISYRLNIQCNKLIGLVDNKLSILLGER